MTTHRPTIDQDDEGDLPDDLLESIDETPSSDDDFGDETQRDDELETEAGLEQDELILPDDED
jgi:hypothetical protein